MSQIHVCLRVRVKGNILPPLTVYIVVYFLRLGGFLFF